MLVVAVVDVKVVVGVVVVGSLHGCACWRCPPPDVASVADLGARCPDVPRTIVGLVFAFEPPT